MTLEATHRIVKRVYHRSVKIGLTHCWHSLHMLPLVDWSTASTKLLVRAQLKMKVGNVTY